MQQRKARNQITQLTLSNGDICTDKFEIRDAILTYFKNFLSKAEARRAIFDGSGFLDKVINDEACDPLCKMPTEKEIKGALWNIKDDKSPGPDGFNSYFFKKTWKIVGKEVCLDVHDFFSNGAMLKQANSTVITLIPKIQRPQKITDYRPISCCNVMYKIISN